MSLMSNRANNKAVKAAKNSFAQSQEILSPYTSPAAGDFASARKGLFQGFQDILGMSHPGQTFAPALNQGPASLLDSLMGNYEEDPWAQEESQLAQSSINNSMAAAGLSGSGLDMAAAANEAVNGAVGAGRQQYLKNIQGVFDDQLKLMKGRSSTLNNLMGMMQDIIQTEFKASNQLANESMREGEIEANSLNRKAYNDKWHPIPYIGYGVGSLVKKLF